MNWFDFIVGVFLVIALIRGYRKGLIMQLIQFSTVIIAAIFGGKVAKFILPELNNLLDISPQVAHVLSYIFAFILISVIVSLIGKVIQKLIDAVYLSFINRLLGAIVATGTVMLLLSIVLNLVLILDTKEYLIKKETKETSFFFNRVESVIPTIVPYLNKEIWVEYVPEKYRKEVERKTDSIYQYLPGNQIDSIYQQEHFNTN